MHKHHIKSKKISDSFIAAAEEIINTKGLSNISARNIAKIAGYSYATIYNYFHDLDELLLYCKLRYLKSYHLYITNHLDSSQPPLDTLINLYSIFLEYTLDYPNQYLLINKQSIPKSSTYSNELIENINHYHYQKIFKQHLLVFFSSGGIIESMHTDIHDIMNSYLYGKIITYLNKQSIDKESFKEEVLCQVEILLTSFLN